MSFSWELRGDGAARGKGPHRRRSWVMMRIAARMLDLGMATDNGPPPKFPLWAVYGVSDFDVLGRPVGGQAQEYETELRNILSWHGDPTTRGIPLHKLTTPLGWHVTTEECREAITAYDQARANGIRHPRIFGTDLIPFLRTAAEQHGFEVH
ncbi:MAG TPA: hypothetical protein VG247_08420 [Pseudonocardiaceae bacterium]|jgi:hypothetical protein|nr:hypothetical protein [Pseudonocardiaceae bacterium]